MPTKDVALCIEKLVPAAKYGGSTTDNTRECYDKLRWEDARKKPTWEEIEAVIIETIPHKSLEERITVLEIKVANIESLQP